MRPFDDRCPRCGDDRVWQSQSGRLRSLARLLFLRPLRCPACDARYWRFGVGKHPPAPAYRRWR